MRLGEPRSTSNPLLKCESAGNRIRDLLFSTRKAHYSALPGLNLKSPRNAYDVKAYLLFIAIRPSDGDVKPGGPVGSLRKYEINAATQFLLHPSSPHINHTLRHNKTHTS